MSGTPLRVARPVAVPAQFVVWGVVVPAVVGLVASLIVSNIVSHDREFTRRWNDGAPAGWRKDEPGTFPWGAAVFVGVLGVGAALSAAKLLVEPGYTEYHIYPDRAEYFEGLLNRVQRTVVFDQVIDVLLVESVLQKTKGVGTVTLVTQQLVSGANGALTNRSFAMWNVPDPQQVYDLIRSLAVKKRP